MESLTSVLKRLSVKNITYKEGFVQLFISKRLIQGLAAAMFALFVPIFIYETSGHEFWVVGLFYAFLSFLYAGLLVPGMELTNRIGFSKALALSAVFAVGQYFTLYFMNAENIWMLLLILAVFTTGFRIFHWVPYQVDFTSFTDTHTRGRDVSLMFATIAFMGVIGPLLAAFIITKAGYQMLFIVGMILLCMAAFSYLFVPAVEQEFTWTYKETITHLFSKKYRNVMVGEMANGAELVVTLIAWPIFLYEIVNGNLLEIGLLSTVIVGVTIVIQLLVGKHLDKESANKISTLRKGSVLYAAGWIFKMFVLSATQIFFVGLYHNITKIFIKTPYSAILYDMSAEQGQYIDEFTVLREISGHVARAFALLLMVLLTLYLSIEWTFIIGIIASLTINLVYYTNVKTEG